jgi:hypothetical protein
MGGFVNFVAQGLEKATSGDKTINFFPTESRKQSFIDGKAENTPLSPVDEAIKAHDEDIERQQKTGERRAKLVEAVNDNVVVGQNIGEKLDYKNRSALKEKNGVY